jgi:chemotaxis protein CheY-P-specific phosphatase CheC
MLGCPVWFTGATAADPPTGALSALGSHATGRSVTLLRVRVDGNGRGWALVLLPIWALHRMLRRLVGAPGASRDLTDVDRSAVQEFGNVLVSAFLSEVGDRLGRRLLSSPPELYLEDVRPPIRDVLAWAKALDAELGVVQARLTAPVPGIDGHVVFVLDVGALPIAHEATGMRGVSR